MTRDSRLGVPTNSCMSKRPGRMMAESNARRRLVAKKNMDFFARRKSLSWVSMEVVSNRDSMPNPGVSRSRQNSSISSNKITQSVSDSSRSKTYLILDATLVSPSSRKFAVSITTKSHPIRSARASHIVDLAVPGGPNRMAEYAAPTLGTHALPASGIASENGPSMRSSRTSFRVLCPATAGSPRSVSRSLSHEAGLGTPPLVFPPNSSSTSMCSSRCTTLRILITAVKTWAVDQATGTDDCTVM
mmetsp:Transcript_2175/g.5099  ORF Transcript_2175/g.5099 Transcript_2175/m.5099 type:complete len:245 (+) Transcript_2175:397-1131(+)